MYNKGIMIGIAAATVLLFAAGCGKKDDYEWVTPAATTTAPAETTTLPRIQAVTQAEAQEALETEYPDCTVAFVQEETYGGSLCYVFSVQQTADYDATEPFELIDDTFYIAEADGRTILRQISEEKAQRILSAAYPEENFTFTKTGDSAEVAGVLYYCYQAENSAGIYEHTILISAALGNEVLEGTQSGDGTWDVKLVSAY